MASPLLRPDDLELVRQAARTTRRESGAPVVFGGLRSQREIPVSVVSGAQTAGLTSIRIAPERGLGGLSWIHRRPAAVADYERSTDITHDFDRQILGEGITGLAVAPIVVGEDVRGLLYSGFRGSAGEQRAVESLARAASQVAYELRIRDLVDERIQLLKASTSTSITSIPQSLRASLLALADTTHDPATAHELRDLVRMGAGRRAPESSDARVALTPRQRDVLELVELGQTNSQIAERLGLSVLTVKSYLRAVMTALDADTRTRAALEARRRNLL